MQSRTLARELALLILGQISDRASATAPSTETSLEVVLQQAQASLAEHVREALDRSADELRRATPHWMRHTHATHVLQRGAGLTTVRENLRHASLSSRSMYLHPGDLRWDRQIGGVFEAPAS
jgi:site-specific recombinase XerC